MMASDGVIEKESDDAITTGLVIISNLRSDGSLHDTEAQTLVVSSIRSI